MPTILAPCCLCHRVRGLTADGRCPRCHAKRQHGRCPGCRRVTVLHPWGTCLNCSRPDRANPPRSRVADALCRFVHEAPTAKAGRVLRLGEALAESFAEWMEG